MGEAVPVRVIRVELPAHLRGLAGVGREVEVPVPGRVTARAVLDALEARHPELRGTIRDYERGERRAYLRFFAGGEDVSFAGMDAELPEVVVLGTEALLVIGAVAGG